MLRPTAEDRPHSLRRLLAVDPLGPACALLAGFVYWLHGFNGYLSRDLALYAYAGQQVADGVPPYEGVYNRSGPLSHLVPGLGALVGRVTGVDELSAMRVQFLILSIVSIWLAYLMGRELLSSRLAGVATAIALFGVSAFNLYATTGPREKTTLVLFLLCAFLAVARRRYGWAGVFVSLATLTWQPSLFVGAPFALAALWAIPRAERLRAFVRFTIGGLVPLVVFLVYYTAIGQLRLFLDCFVLIHVQYTDQPGAEQDFEAVWEVLREAYGTLLWGIVIGAVAILVAAVLALAVPSRRRDPEQRVLAAAGVGLLVGLLWCLVAFNGFPDIFFILPATILGIGYIARVVADHTPMPVAVAAVVAWTAVVTVGQYHYSTQNQDGWLDIQRREIAAAFDVLPDDATVVSVEAPQPLVLTGRTNPLPIQIFDYGMEDYVDATWPGGLVGFGEDIDELQPTIIARGTTRPYWLEGTLAEDYWRVGTTPGLTWYVNRSVDAETQAALRAAINGG
jgi:hypothetical protein